MGTVWLLWEGEYSDKSVRGVFSSRELAQRALDREARETARGPYYIEGHPLDADVTDPREDRLLWYRLQFTASGDIHDIEAGTYQPQILNQVFADGATIVSVFARSAEQAVQEATVRRAALITEGKGRE